MKSSESTKLYSPEERPKSQVRIVVTPTSEEDLSAKIGTDMVKGRPRRPTKVLSPTPLQHNIIIPEEAVRSKK